MREEQLAGITVRLTGGDDREGGGDGPLVVLMHGLFGSGDNLRVLARGFEDSCTIVLPDLTRGS